MKKYFVKQVQKFKEKSLFAKISDIFFALFFLALLIPATRKPVASGLIRLASWAPSVSQGYIGKVNANTSKWELTDSQGKISTFADFENKVILLNFWATWCPPCIGEMPSMEELYSEYKDRVVFLFISNEHPDKVNSFIKRKGFDIPVYFSKQTPPKEFYSSSVPVTYVVDKKGNIVLKKTGAARWNSNKVKKFLDKLCSE